MRCHPRVRWLPCLIALVATSACTDAPVVNGDAGPQRDAGDARDGADEAAVVRDAGDVGDADDVRDAGDVTDASDVDDVTDASDVDDVVDASDVDDVIDASDVGDADDVVDAGDDVRDVTDASTDDGAADASDGAPTVCPLTLMPALRVEGDRVMGTVAGPSRNATSTCGSVGGPEVVFPLRVTARTGVMLSTVGSGYDTVLLLRRACDAVSTEIACNDDVVGGTASMLRRVLDPGDYFVVLEQYGSSGRGGAYTLELAPFTPSTNADCARATALVSGVEVVGDVREGLFAAGGCLNDQWGPQQYFTLTVPPGQRATVHATPERSAAPWRAVVRARSSCTATACLASGTSYMAGDTATAVFDNRGAAPLPVVLSVGSSNGMTGGAYALLASLSTPPMAPANAACVSATRVDDGAVLSGESPGLGTVRLNDVCLASAQGTTLFYTAAVPPRNALTFTVRPSGSWDVALRLLGGCASTSCLASVDAAGGGGAETLRWTNTGLATQNVVVAVSSVSSTAGTFDGSVRIVAPPPNVTCAGALTLDPDADAPLVAQNGAAGTENLTGPCLPGATGTVLYYRVTVPAGELLTVSARPATNVDPVIRLLDACGARACLASTNATGVNGTETLSYTNTSSSDATWIVAVGGATNATNGSFDVRARTRREYTETTIASACVDMSGATALAGLASDDAASTLADLPFPFEFYGERELEYSVSTNGLLQLFPTLMATPSTAYENQPIPTAAPPSRFVAPFWDDLVPSPTSRVLVRTVGTAPDRRFVVQWTDFAPFGDSRARITMQAHLFEGSDAIEMHYCALTPGMLAGRVTGDSATVGIESPDGSAGRQHSFNTPMSVSTTTALRYTP